MAALFLRSPVQAAAALMRRHHEASQLGMKRSLPKRRQWRGIARSAGQVTDSSKGSSSKGELTTTTTTAIKASLSMALQEAYLGSHPQRNPRLRPSCSCSSPTTPHHTPLTPCLIRKVDGRWKLVYSTVTILGAKRTKLGLRDFINLGDFFQIIDVAKEKATNVIEFNARGFKMIAGHLTIEASFKIVSKTRVDIKLENSSITPDQLRNLFQKNYDLLLAIFNPEGWLEISYVDDSTRIGRDDKGNIFVLERAKQEEV